MDGERHGQRLLLALSSRAASEEQAGFDHGIVGTAVGLVCLALVVVMCACTHRKPKDNEQDASQTADASYSKAMAPGEVDSVETRIKAPGDNVVLNGGQAIVNMSQNSTEHKRQASTSSSLRPTSLRELPEPPVSARHSRNTSMSGMELPPLPDTAEEVLHNAGPGGDRNQTVGNNTYAYPKHMAPRGATAGGKVVGAEKDGKVKSHSDGYDHLGQKVQGKPTDYDNLSPGSRESEGTPLSETGRANHYSLVRERTYDIVKDVKGKASKQFDPYSTVSDKNMEGGEIYRPTKDEDPYNHIGESDGIMPNSFLRHLRQSSDITDPYSTVQDGSGGDLKSLNRGSATSAKGLFPSRESGPSSPISNHHHDYDDTDDEDNPCDEQEEAEYAVVHKSRGNSERRPTTGARGSHTNSDDYSFYGAAAMPPEPPRLYNAYDDEEESYSVTSPTGEKKEHKYSKVTARESLASMSARNALNPYETVQDLPENTYATVEGGSGDGVVLRHVDSDVNSNRNSQSSDTYAEIAISGGGLSSSIISSGSTGNNNNNSISTASSGANSNMNTSMRSGAPAPPSLDSLHLMTKSQTSSEGDRHLATPEDTGLDNLASPLHAGDGLDFVDRDDDSGGSVSEDGYSTLKRVEGDRHPPVSTLPDIPVERRGAGNSESSQAGGRRSDLVVVMDKESGETTQLSPGYTTVKDCMSREDLRENDPNYESVDEARAKLRLLYKTERSLAGHDGEQGRKNVTVVKVSHSVKSSTTSYTSVSHSSSSSLHQHTPPSLTPRARLGSGSKPRRRPNHDYEELDLSPPLSPSPSSIPSPSTRHSTTVVPVSPSSPARQEAASWRKSLAEEKERLVRSHMYEELSEVRAKSSRFSRGSSSGGTTTVPVGVGASPTSPSLPQTPTPTATSPFTQSPSSPLSSPAASSFNLSAGPSSSRLGDRTSNSSRLLGSSGNSAGLVTPGNDAKAADGAAAAKPKTRPATLKKWHVAERDVEAKNKEESGGDRKSSKEDAEFSPYIGTRV